MTDRTRWTDSRSSSGDPAFTGHVGDLYALFKIWPPEDPGDEWLLTVALPGKEGERLYGFPIDLKLEAERWLEEFVSSLGAVFEAESDESASFQLGEARDMLARWDAEQGGEPVHSREKVLADQVRALLAIADRVSPEWPCELEPET